MANIHLSIHGIIILIIAFSLPAEAATPFNPDSAKIEVSTHFDGVNGSTHIHLGGTRGKINILFIHGLLFGLNTWDGIAEALPHDEFRTIRYDLIGQGESAKPDIQYNSDPFLLQLDEVWEYAEIDSPLIIVASSMGAILAAQKVCEIPENISGVVLVAPAGLQPEPPRGFRLVVRPIVALPIFYLLSQCKWLLKTICSKILSPENQEILIPELQRHYRNHECRRSLISTLQDFPLYDAGHIYKSLGELKIPTLVFWGGQDRVLPYPGRQVMYEHLPHAQIEVVEDGYHALQCNRPDAINAKILEFLANLD